MEPYLKELRTRVVAAVEQGDMTIGEVAGVFSVGKTFVKKMLRLQRAGEDLAPRQDGGSPPKLADTDRALLRGAVAQQTDVTLAECQAVLAAQGSGRASVPTICCALQHLASSLSLPISGRRYGCYTFFEPSCFARLA